MIAYHIDRKKALSEGMTLKLQPSGLSYHGENYLRPYNVKDIDHVKDAIAEHIFEEVRLAHFPDKPSRFASLFGCLDLNNINQWGSALKVQGTDTPVWEIEANSAFIGDASLLRCLTDGPQGVFYNLPLTRQCAFAYWSGANSHYLKGLVETQHVHLLATTPPLMECLLPLPARVLRRF